MRTSRRAEAAGGTAARRGPRALSFGLALTGSFAAVIAAFTAATIYSETRGHAVDQAALLIATTAAPTIQHLTAARSALSQVRAAEREYVEAVKLREPATSRAMRLAHQTLRGELSAENGFTAGSTRVPFWAEASERIRRLDVAAAALLAADPAPRPGFLAADALFRAAAEEAAQALDRSIGVNAQRARGLALRIEQLRTHTRHLAFLLNFLCGLATAVAAFLLSRVWRGHQRLLQEHHRFLESRSDEMEAFAARVAHDIRSSLAGVSLSLQQAQRLTGDPDVNSMLTRGLRHTDRIVRISDGLLGFARAGARPEPGAHTEVSEVLADVISGQQGAASTAGIEVAVEPGSPSAVACTPGVLTSILGNLVTNAIKYAAGSPQRRIVVRALDRGRSVRVEVDDAGPGVPAHLRRAIFEPYVRANDAGEPGVGLGLATVKRLAEGHGGRVGVEPSPAGGSRFWFELPRSGPTPLEGPTPAQIRVPGPI
jgi:signal transduction histidine kinase